MKLYNVRQLLRKVKEVFDAAEQEEEVLVLRDKKVFKVCLANNQDLSRFIEKGIISKNPRPKTGESNDSR